MENDKRTGLSKTKLKNSFWKSRQELVRTEVIPYQLKALEDGVDGAEPSRCMENFRKAANVLACRRAGKNTPVYPTDKWHYTDENAQPGAFKGWVFQDSDLY